MLTPGQTASRCLSAVYFQAQPGQLYRVATLRDSPAGLALQGAPACMGLLASRGGIRRGRPEQPGHPARTSQAGGSPVGNDRDYRPVLPAAGSRGGMGGLSRLAQARRVYPSPSASGRQSIALCKRLLRETFDVD